MKRKLRDENSAKLIAITSLYSIPALLNHKNLRQERLDEDEDWIGNQTPLNGKEEGNSRMIMRLSWGKNVALMSTSLPGLTLSLWMFMLSLHVEKISKEESSSLSLLRIGILLGAEERETASPHFSPKFSNRAYVYNFKVIMIGSMAMKNGVSIVRQMTSSCMHWNDADRMHFELENRWSTTPKLDYNSKTGSHTHSSHVRVDSGWICISWWDDDDTERRWSEEESEDEEELETRLQKSCFYPITDSA